MVTLKDEFIHGGQNKCKRCSFNDNEQEDDL